MKICLSVAGDPDASFVFCRTGPLWLITPLAFAQLPGITSQPLLVVDKAGRSRCRRWCSSPRYVYSGNFTDDDQFHPHHYCFGLLRNALGTPSAPPNQVLLGWHCF